MKLSPHFDLTEFTVSQTAARLGLDNRPPLDALDNLRRVAQWLEGVRILLGVPIIISSGYRSPDVNKAVGGARNSQHLTGQAVDFTAPGFGSPRHVVDRIIDAGVEFDQLIVEFDSWVHAGVVKGGGRRQALIIDRTGTRALA